MVDGDLPSRRKSSLTKEKKTESNRFQMRTTSSARGGRKEKKKKARRKRTGGAKRSRRIPIIDHSNPRPGGYPPSIAGCHPISILVAARLLGALPSACLKAFQIRVVMDIIVPSFKSCTVPTSSAPHVSMQTFVEARRTKE